MCHAWLAALFIAKNSRLWTAPGVIPPSRLPMKTRNRAFTLIELLVVITIIAILAALIMPALKAANAARDESVALSNMRQIGVAFSLYANDNSFMLPSRVMNASVSGTTTASKWPVLLSAYLSDVRVYASSFDTQNWILRGLTTTQALSNTANNTSFIMNGYNDLNTLNNPGVQIRINAFPDTSDIILLGTPLNPPFSAQHNAQFYMDFEEAPNGNENDVLNLAAFNGGSNYLFADGSARFITQAAYQAPSPNPPPGSSTLQSYGNTLWCVNKSYVIPSIGH
jgi:prepilin-type N-terminal cleavage/methylation domain-containing protein/prepilin-type processing-associated H-X9-DG protein